jgi:heme-degrading monooxygenase HmoA
MIVRSWTGWTNTAQAEAYEAYMHEVALPGYSTTPGNRGVLMLRRDLEDGVRTEFTMVSLWDSMDDVRRFAGDNPESAVFYDRDAEFLIEREWTVRHYQVYGQTSTLGKRAESRGSQIGRR